MGNLLDIGNKVKKFLLSGNVEKLSQTISAPFRWGGEQMAKPITKSLLQGGAMMQTQLQQGKVLPDVTPFSNKTTLGNIGNMATNLAPSMLNTIYAKGLMQPTYDVTKNIQNVFQGKTITPYNELLSPQARLGYNAMGINANPKQILGNVAGALEPIATAYMPKGGEAVLRKGIDEAVKKGFFQVVKEGAITGTKFGGGFGLISGLEQNRNVENNLDYLKNVGISIGSGVTFGGLLGAATSGGGYAFGAARNIAAKTYQRLFPSADSAEATAKAGKWLRDDLNRLAGKGKSQTPEPSYYGDLRESLGLPRNGIEIGQNRRGAINLGYDLTGKKSTQPKGGVPEGGVGVNATKPQSKGVVQTKPPKPPSPQIGQPGVLETAKVSPDIQRNLESPSIVQPPSPIIPPGAKERGFVTSVKETPRVTEGVKAGVAGTYVPKPNAKLMGEAQSLLNEGVTIKFDKIEGLDKKVAATIKEALNADKSGNPQLAANLYNNLSEHGTELGRSVQAFSLIDKMSPEAISLSAAGKIKLYNRTATRPIPELTGEQVQQISNAVSKIDGLVGREKNIAINQLQEMINNYIPSTFADKAITVWKAGLLTSLRTHERNILGNTIMGAGEVAKDLPATLADKAMALSTGKRTTTFTIKGTKEGTLKGLKAFEDIMNTGYDPEQAISKFDVHRVTWGKNPVEQTLKKATDIVFRALGGADKPFWNASYARSLYDQAGAEAINVGKQGNKAFITSLVKNPTEGMMKTAFNDANTATFHDKAALSSLANTLKRELGKSEWTKVIGEVTMPFTGVPSSIVGKTIAYSPLGLVRGAVDFGRVLAGQVPELQRQAAQEIGRGVVGTGLFGLGAYLMGRGLMTGQPKDAKESALWQTQGKQANSVFVMGKWRSINSIGPQNLVMLAGAKLQEELGKPEGSLGAYGMQLGKDQLSQTFLAGVQGPLSAVTDPARYGKSYVGNQAASIIPNIIKDVSKAFDPNARETNTFQDYIKQGIPGVRNTLLPKRDVLGNIVPQEPTGIGAFIDLFNSKTPIDNAVVKELTRLDMVGNEATPSKLTTNQTILKQKIKLTFEQLNNLEAGVGEMLRPQLETLISSPAYQQLDDERKAKAIDSLVQDVRTKYKNLNAEQIIGNQTGTGVFKASLTGQEAQSVSYVDEQGNLKTIDFSPISPPFLTGLTELDKRAISKFNSAINSRANDIFKLWELSVAGTIKPGDPGYTTQDDAEKALNGLKKLRASVGTKKMKKLSIAKLTVKPLKIKTTKTKKYKMAKSPTMKIASKKLPAIKVSAPKEKKYALKTSLTKRV